MLQTHSVLVKSSVALHDHIKLIFMNFVTDVRYPVQVIGLSAIYMLCFLSLSESYFSPDDLRLSHLITSHYFLFDDLVRQRETALRTLLFRFRSLRFSRTHLLTQKVRQSVVALRMYAFVTFESKWPKLNARVSLVRENPTILYFLYRRYF